MSVSHSVTAYWITLSTPSRLGEWGQVYGVMEAVPEYLHSDHDAFVLEIKTQICQKEKNLRKKMHTFILEQNDHFIIV